MKSTIEGIETELINVFKNKSELVKTVDILSQLDVSPLSQTIEHKHPSFSKEALLKLYLYKGVKGIATYPELLKNLDGEAIKLGFTELPSKRTFNEFIQQKADKQLVEQISELILKTATQNKIILDIELVKKTIEKKRKEINRYQKELREATKLIKRLVYPQIDLKIHHNATFTTKDLLDVLVHVAANNDFCNNGSMTFKELNPDRKVPHGDTLMYHFNKFESIEDIKLIFERIFDVILNFAKLKELKGYPEYNQIRLILLEGSSDEEFEHYLIVYKSLNEYAKDLLIFNSEEDEEIKENIKSANKTFLYGNLGESKSFIDYSIKRAEEMGMVVQEGSLILIPNEKDSLEKQFKSMSKEVKDLIEIFPNKEQFNKKIESTFQKIGS